MFIEWRAQEQAILVGTRTAAVDNPELTVRLVKGPNPIRIVIDKNLSLSPTLTLFDGTVKTLLVTEQPLADRPGCDVLRLTFDKSFVAKLLKSLCEQNITSLFVEGGATTLEWFLESNLWDEIRVFSSTAQFGSGVPAPGLPPGPFITTKVADDTLMMGINASLEQRLEITGAMKRLHSSIPSKI